jgi:rare lipoprotein A
MIYKISPHPSLPKRGKSSPFGKGGRRGIWVFLLLSCSIFVFTSCATPRYEPYGVASWYGPDFHGRPTSSGEIFNMYDYTCAHKEYPFGTRLKVTNISTNKSVYCLVNDRGPFVDGRVIDLSYAAAKEIGLIEQGTSQVRIEYMGRDNSYIKEVMYVSNRGPFTIQVGSFREILNASRLKTALEMKYDRVYITETVLGGNRFYRVRVGKFNLRDDVNNIAKILADEGYSVLITAFDEM